MEYTQIKYELADRIATITLNRPEKLNAWTQYTMCPELLDALEKADNDDAVRVIIFTGAGRAFCAGADLHSAGKTFDYGTPERNETMEEHRDSGGRVALRIFEMKKPVIAAINGPAVGVGINITLPMDFRLASDTAKFGFVFVRRGILLESASTWFLPRIVGMSRALDWSLTGRVFTAGEALTGGLVSEVLSPDALMPRAREIALEIANNTSAVSVAMNRKLLWKMQGAGHPMEAHLLDSKLMYWAGRQTDAREGVTSFLEKRPPEFRMSVKDLPGFL